MNPFDSDDEEVDTEPVFDLRANQQRFSDAYKFLISKGYRNIQNADQAYSVALSARVMGKNDIASAANIVRLLFDEIAEDD